MKTFFVLCLNAFWMLYPFVRPLKTLTISEPRLVDFSIVMLQSNHHYYISQADFQVNNKTFRALG